MIETIIIKFTLILFILHLIFFIIFLRKKIELMVVVVCKKFKKNQENLTF